MAESSYQDLTQITAKPCKKNVQAFMDGKASVIEFDSVRNSIRRPSSRTNHVQENRSAKSVCVNNAGARQANKEWKASMV
jgi:hypothetical protein